MRVSFNQFYENEHIQIRILIFLFVSIFDLFFQDGESWLFEFAASPCRAEGGPFTAGQLVR